MHEFRESNLFRTKYLLLPIDWRCSGALCGWHTALLRLIRRIVTSMTMVTMTMIENTHCTDDSNADEARLVRAVKPRERMAFVITETCIGWRFDCTLDWLEPEMWRAFVETSRRVRHPVRLRHPNSTFYTLYDVRSTETQCHPFSASNWHIVDHTFDSLWSLKISHLK